MKKLTDKLFITLFLIVSINIFAQSLMPYKVVYIINKNIEKGEYIDHKKESNNKINTYKLIYKYNSKNDTLIYYDFYDSEVKEKKTPSICTLTKSKDFLLLDYKKQGYKYELKIIFNDTNKSISIGSKDIFYLNDLYYKYLHKSIYDKLNILDLIDLLEDFLEDFLEDYNLFDLKDISSNEKYKNKNFRIIKAQMESSRTQADDYIDKWNVKFLYRKDGILKYILKESTEGDQGLEKKLISFDGKTLKYNKHTNVESRLIVDTEIELDISKKRYARKITEFGSITAGGLAKEKKYDIIRVFYNEFNSTQLFLTSKDISKINLSK